MKYEIIVAGLGDITTATEVARDFISSNAGENPYFNYVFVLRMLNLKDKAPESLWDPDLAIELASRAVQRADEPNPDYMAVLAKVHILRGEREQAILWQQKAIEAAPAAQRESLGATLREYESAE